jgi:hypothetical protein
VRKVSEQGLEELVGFESDAWLDRYNALAEVYGMISEVCGEDPVVGEEQYKGIDADGVELTVDCNGKKYKVLVVYRHTAAIKDIVEEDANE